MKAMPANWQPPVDAWQAEYDNLQQERVFAYFAVQFRPPADASKFADVFLTAARQGPSPVTLSRARYTDASGFENVCFIAYWDRQADHDAWWQESGFGAWWEDSERLTEPFGMWREVYAVAPNNFETLASSRQPTGIARLGKPFGEPVREHNYWGGMRDRVKAAAVDGDLLESSMGPLLPAAQLRPTRGKRVRVTVPGNLCLIRSGQDLSQCTTDEAETYFDVVHPHLAAGMAFLRDNAEASGCASCRYMVETELDGGFAPRSFGLAAFISMAHLEAWAHEHPSHLAIFGSFFEMMKACQGRLNLQLWHEVLVCSEDRTICEYVNCHPRTGLLPYFVNG
jgi:aldoxime dehydratase